MNCGYFYKDHFIGNEILATDFLMSVLKYYPKLGDMVFEGDFNVVKAKIDAKIVEDLIPRGQTAKDLLARWALTAKKPRYLDGERIVDDERPYIGTNRYLAHYIRNDNTRLEPVFDDEAYWKQAFLDWKPTTNETGAIVSAGKMKDDIREIITEATNSPIDLNVEYDLSTYETWKKIVINKWKYQAALGSAIHGISEMMFSKSKSDPSKYNYLLMIGNEEETDKLFEEFLKKTDEYGVNIAEALDKDPEIRKKQFLEITRFVLGFRKDLLTRFGENCTFYPELGITSPVSKTQDGCDKIIGIIDLLVIDKDGNPHIFDYKTSTKSYDAYDDAKRRAFTYQLAVYDKMLLYYGINTSNGSNEIVPIKLNGITYKDGDYTYKNISYDIIPTKIDDEYKNLIDTKNITADTKSPKVLQDIDEFLPTTEVTTAVGLNLIENVTTRMQRWFPNHRVHKGMTDEEINNMLEEKHCYKPNKLNFLTWRPNKYSRPILQDASDPLAKEKFFKQVKDYIQTVASKKENIVSGFIESWKQSVELQEDFSYIDVSEKGGDSEWLQNNMAQYCTGDYKLLDIPEIRPFGMFILENQETKALHVFKLSGDKLDRKIKFGTNNTNLNGAFVSDVVENSKTNSYMLKAALGNIEAMEAMHVLNCLEFNQKDIVIGEINVINPFYQLKLPISLKELLYNFRNLASHEKKKFKDSFNNRFEKGDLHIADPIQMLLLRFREIISKEPQRLHRFKTYLDQNAIDLKAITGREELYLQLNILRSVLENQYKATLKYITQGKQRTSASLATPEAVLYSLIMDAMLFLKNKTVRQQLEDADNWVQTFRHCLTEGLEGLNLENPGNFRSHVLNQITSSVKNVYQKVADVVNKRNVKVRELVSNLKTEKNFGWMDEKISNQTDLYKNMFREVDGDLWFERPENLTSKAEREFLEYVLDTINKDRHALNIASLEDWKKNDNEKYYRVPIMKASTGSRLSTDGLLGNLRDRVKDWASAEDIIQKTKEVGKQAVEDFFEGEEKSKRKTHELYEVANMFQSGETDEDVRKKMIVALGGVNGIEHNLENLLLMHSFQYLQLAMMNLEMPIIKASVLAIANAGSSINPSTSNFDNTIDFILHFVTNKINGEEIDENKFQVLQKPIGKIRQVSSFLAMAFNPVQFTYQKMEQIWKHIGLVIKKPDGTDAFSAKNMWNAWSSTEKNLLNFTGDPSMDDLLNETYRISDMDSRQFALKISSDQGWFTHFNDFAFRFATRADYYSRLTIFKAFMELLGSIEAHSMLDGKLVYDWTKDKRYAAYAEAKKAGRNFSEMSDSEKESYSKYLAAALQFVEEGVSNEDGSLFKIGDALPRAYTNQEATGMKAIADNSYGYYNHEDKSMFSSMFLGGLYMQMKTYWSAKKNQYMAPGGVKLMGHFENYIEDGKLMYYAKAENGEIDLEAEFVTEDDPKCSGVKVLQWKGQWLEGIIVTLSNLAVNMAHRGDKSIGDIWREAWNNPDENLRVAFLSNIKHLIIDISITIAFGGFIATSLKGWDDEKREEFNKDKGNFGKALDAFSAHFIYKSFKNSTLDFNPVDSILSGVVDWQPFSFSMIGRVAANTWDAITGDKTVLNAAASSIATVGTFKPLLLTLTYNEAA